VSTDNDIYAAKSCNFQQDPPNAKVNRVNAKKVTQNHDYRTRYAYYELSSVSIIQHCTLQTTSPTSAFVNTNRIIALDMRLVYHVTWHYVSSGSIQFLGYIECMRCWLLLPMFAVSDYQSVCQSVTWLKSAAARAVRVRRVPCARGHSVQPSSNVFGLSL